MPYGVSNSFKRATLKTYSRQPPRVATSCDYDIPRKRIRMDETGTVVEEILGLGMIHGLLAPSENPVPSSTVPSSPTPSFSDDTPLNLNKTSQTPPSSPPARIPSPKPAARKAAFSFLKRKRSLYDGTLFNPTNQPLSDMSPNPQKTPRLGKKPRLTQMQIDLGGEVRKTCKTCGMEHIPSNTEDAALHQEFHAMNVQGVGLGKSFLKERGMKRIFPESRVNGDAVVVVDRRSAHGVRSKVKKVLEVVNAELSATEIPDNVLWAGLSSSEPAQKLVVRTRAANGEGTDRQGDRFKAFLYLMGDKCVGFCLAEKIITASQVIDPEDDDKASKSISTFKGSSILTSNTDDVALLGISRIWTSKSHRSRGIAIGLLDAARSNFFYGVEVPKDLVAFSQPTESGGRLAKRWFEAETGWRVYRGDI